MLQVNVKVFPLHDQDALNTRTSWLARASLDPLQRTHLGPQVCTDFCGDF